MNRWFGSFSFMLSRANNYLADSFSVNDAGFRRPGVVYGGLSLLGSGVSSMARYGYRKRFRSRFQISSKGRKRFKSGGRRPPTTSGNGVTVQHDRRQVYRKKPMRRLIKRRWKKFSRKVNAVSEKELGSRTIVFNRSVNWTLGSAFYNQTNANHLFLSFSLYGGESTGYSWFNDLKAISGYENAGNPTAAAGGYADPTTKFIFKSAVLDLTITNTSATILTPGTPPTANTYSGKMEIDIYEITANMITSDALTDPLWTSDMFSVGATDTASIGALATGIGIQQRGVTPWDLPQALSRNRIKIWKKTKFFLDSLGTLTYQVRDPKRRVISRAKMTAMNSCNFPGWTKHVFVIAKLVNPYTVGSAAGEYVEKLDVGLTRKYLYKLEGQNDDRDLYVNA